MTTYRDTIASLISSFPIEIDTDIQLSGKLPTMASSNFLTNKEQGDWAEQIVEILSNVVDGGERILID